MEWPHESFSLRLEVNQMPALNSAPYLKPCPFCGCELESKWNRANPSAKCATPDCMGAKLPSLCLDVPEHIKAWNTRAEVQEALIWKLIPQELGCGLKTLITSSEYNSKNFEIQSCYEFIGRHVERQVQSV